MPSITKKSNPLILSDYAVVGSAYSKLHISNSAWTLYGNRKDLFLELYDQVSEYFKNNEPFPDWLWNEYTEARETLLTMHELMEQEFSKAKRIVVKENEIHRFNDDDTTTVSLKEDI